MLLPKLCGLGHFRTRTMELPETQNCGREFCLPLRSSVAKPYSLNISDASTGTKGHAQVSTRAEWAQWIWRQEKLGLSQCVLLFQMKDSGGSQRQSHPGMAGGGQLSEAFLSVRWAHPYLSCWAVINGALYIGFIGILSRNRTDIRYMCTERNSFSGIGSCDCRGL